MNPQWLALLAKDDDSPGIGRLLPLIILAVLWLLSRVFKKAKEQADRQKAAHREAIGKYEEHEEYEEYEEPPEVARAQDATVALRQALGMPEPAPPPAPPRAVGAERPRADLRQRHMPAGAGGKGVAEEVHRMEGSRTAEDVKRRRRLGGPGGPAGGGDEAARAVRVSVDLTGRQEAIRAIVHSEILGPPKALRRGPEMWEI